MIVNRPVRFLKSIYCRIYRSDPLRRRRRCGKMRYGQIEEVVSRARASDWDWESDRASDATSESMREAPVLVLRAESVRLQSRGGTVPPKS